MRPSHALLLLIFSAVVLAEDSSYEFGGHTKFRLVGQTFPDDSLFRDLVGSDAIDVEGDLRLNFSTSRGGWSFNADYQLFVLYGDSVELGRELRALTGLSTDRFPNDQSADGRPLGLAADYDDSHAERQPAGERHSRQRLRFDTGLYRAHRSGQRHDPLQQQRQWRRRIGFRLHIAALMAGTGR